MTSTATARTIPGGRAVAPSAIARGQRHEAFRVLEPLGFVQYLRRDQAIYTEGDQAEHWYKVVSGAVRTCKVMADGRRQIGEILVTGDFFGFAALAVHSFGAEAVADGTVVIRYPRGRIEMLAEADARLNLRFREMAFDGLTRAHARLVLLGRQTAIERVAAFLLEMAERLDASEMALDLPTSRQDIADYLGLTIETVCRALGELKRRYLIALPTPQRVELLDRAGLETLGGCA